MNARTARVTSHRMARRNQKSELRLPEQLVEVRSVRLQADLAKAIDEFRGEVSFSDFAREVLHRAITNHERQAVEDCLEHMRRRGVTVEMLLKAK